MEKINICRTAVGIAVQAAKLLGRPYEYKKHTTLNERFDVNPEAHLDITTPPDVKYYAIGRGGHRVHIDDSETPIMDPVSHETTNTGPFKAIPFVLREVNNDLTATERKEYALRVKETHNGIDYWAYYLKRLPEVAVPADVIHDNTKEGVTTSRIFQYTVEDLYPTPSDLPATGVVVSSADIIRISAKVIIDFNEKDVEEFYRVNKILYGSEQRSIISEILICSGVDRDTKVLTSNDATVAFKEAIGVQVVTFVTTYIQLGSANRGFYHEYELGEGEPLLTKGETRSTRYSIDVLPSADAATLAGTAYDASNINNGNGVSTTASIAANKPTTPGDRQLSPAP